MQKWFSAEEEEKQLEQLQIFLTCPAVGLGSSYQPTSLGGAGSGFGAKKGAIKCADGELRRNQNFSSNASAGPEVEAQLFVLELAAHASPDPKQLVRKTSISASKNREIDRMIGPNPSEHRKEFGDKKWDP